MPAPTSPNFDRAHDEQAENDTLFPYISKSRLTQYIKNPRHFYYNYVQGLKQPETYPMYRGTQVHSAIEAYYLNVIEEYERSGDVFSDITRYIPDDVSIWADWIEPYFSNFLLFEQRRHDHCAENDVLDAYVPLAVEAEVWDWGWPIPLMGFADMVLNGLSLPDINEPGAVVCDTKTGKHKSAVKYGAKPGGIRDELEYYAMLFEDEYDVVAVMGYYPRNNGTIVGRPDPERRERLVATLAEMQVLTDDESDYPCNENILCCWGPGEEQQSAYYDLCPCTWGTPSGAGPTFRDENKKPIGSQP